MNNNIKLFNAIKEALQEMEKFPGDSVQDIWNESLKSWETGLKMNHLLELEVEIKPNNNDIFQAAALSKGVCSKTGLKLTSNNSQVHHIGGDGTTDKENVKFELISDIANGMLSNFSDKVIKNR